MAADSYPPAAPTDPGVPHSGTRKYAEAYCRISSYLQSMAYQGYNPLVAIQIALAC